MAENGIVHRTHRVLQFAITMLTGILAGFLISHSVMLGRYFTWLIESGNYQVFADTFSVFRETTRANVHYNLFLWVSFIVGIIWTIFCFIIKKKRIIALIAGLSSFWVACVFFASGFSDAEEAVAKGIADEAVRQFFVSWNIPMHISFTIFNTFCFFLLLLSVCRQFRRNTSLSAEEQLAHRRPTKRVADWAKRGRKVSTLFQVSCHNIKQSCKSAQPLAQTVGR